MVRGFEGHNKFSDDLDKIAIPPLTAMKKQISTHQKYWSERCASSIKDYKQVQSSYVKDQGKYENVKKEVESQESRLFLNENDPSNWKIKKRLEESVIFNLEIKDRVFQKAAGQC